MLRSFDIYKRRWKGNDARARLLLRIDTRSLCASESHSEPLSTFKPSRHIRTLGHLATLPIYLRSKCPFKTSGFQCLSDRVLRPVYLFVFVDLSYLPRESDKLAIEIANCKDVSVSDSTFERIIEITFFRVEYSNKYLTPVLLFHLSSTRPIRSLFIRRRDFQPITETRVVYLYDSVRNGRPITL